MKRALAVLLVLIMVLGSLGPIHIGAALKKPAVKVASWTFMVYMSADNNLEPAGVHDLNEMEVAGSTEKVNIVAQMDRAKDYDTTNGDWTSTKRFLVQKDTLNGEIATKELMDLNETDMGDPNTLADFVIWATDNYPAQKYALVFWDHGGAFFGTEWDDDPNGTPAQGSTSDWLSMPDLTTALSNITTHMGRNIDLLAFDACLMADFDVLYQVRHYVNYTVASGYVEPGEGWPYDWILQSLVESPEMSPVELGKIICDDYIDSYMDRSGDPQDTTAVTMALFDSAKVAALGHEIDLVAMALAMNADARPSKGHWFQIYLARDETNSYDFPTGYMPGNPFPWDPGGYCMYDVIGLMDKLIRYLPFDSKVTAQAAAVKEAAQEAMLYFRSTTYQKDVKGAHGITIYFPSGTDTKYNARYDPTAMANETYWDEFLHDYISKKGVTNTPPSVKIDTPKDGDIFQLDRGVFSVSGSAFDFQNDVGKVEYRVDGGEWKTASGSTDWSFVLDTKSLGPGEHTISVRASDASLTSGAIPVVIRVVSPEKPNEGRGPNQSGMEIVALAIVFVALVVMATMALGRFRKRL